MGLGSGGPKGCEQGPVLAPATRYSLPPSLRLCAVSFPFAVNVLLPRNSKGLSAKQRGEGSCPRLGGEVEVEGAPGNGWREPEPERAGARWRAGRRLARGAQDGPGRRPGAGPEPQTPESLSLQPPPPPRAAPAPAPPRPSRGVRVCGCVPRKTRLHPASLPQGDRRAPLPAPPALPGAPESRHPRDVSAPPT